MTRLPSGLGAAPAGSHPSTPRPAETSARPGRFLPPVPDGEVGAKVLAAAWAGDPAIVVASPPGAGKTGLITLLAAHLGARAKLRVAVAVQTNPQALDVTNRIAKATNACPVTLLTRSGARRPRGLAPDVEHTSAPKGLSDGVVVATAARWEWISGWNADVLLVDEAWQMTWATLGALASLAPQFVLVGDPGQIAPVVAADTTRWVAHPAGPHRPAPDALRAMYADAVSSFALPVTRRLGETTTAVVSRFYEFGFRSVRGPSVVSVDGTPLPELVVQTVRSIGGPDDGAVCEEAASLARRLVSHGVVTDGDGSRPLGERDVAVVCAHVAQAVAVQSRLADLRGVAVDTAERHQGLEYQAVIAVDPLVGKAVLGEFDLDAGRLCVMLSRHRSHLTFVTRPDVARVLDATEGVAARRQRAVRAALAEWSQ